MFLQMDLLLCKVWLVPNPLSCLFFLEDKLLLHVTMVAKFLDISQQWPCKYVKERKKKNTWMTFLSTIALRNKTVAHTFLPSLDNADGRLCKERLLRSRNFASMVMWRHTSLLYRVFSLTWPASMQIYCNKRKRLHKKRVQLPQDWFGTPTWSPFHCFGTPIWPPWRHMKTLYYIQEGSANKTCAREDGTEEEEN